MWAVWAHNHEITWPGSGTSQQNVPFKKVGSGTGKQHGLASSRTTFFDLRIRDLQCQTSRPEHIKKRWFYSFGFHFAPRIGFEMHLNFWPKTLPKKAGPGTGKQHGLASSRTPFFDLRIRDLQCQTSRPEHIKKRWFYSFGFHFAPRIGFEMHLNFWPKTLPKKAGPGTGKQYGLASSRTPFFDLRMRNLQCQTSRPDPFVRDDFAALGLLYPKAFPKRLAPKRGEPIKKKHDFAALPKSLPKKAGSGTGKQHGLASWRTPFFDLRWGDLQCQTSRPEPIKKKRFCSFGAPLPKSLPEKGWLRNGETAWPGELKDTVFRPALGWSSMSNVASRTYKKEMILQLWGSFT